VENNWLISRAILLPNRRRLYNATAIADNIARVRRIEPQPDSLSDVSEDSLIDFVVIPHDMADRYDDGIADHTGNAEL